MSIRDKELQWYKKKYRKLDKPIYCSKFYQPNESWPKTSVWWPQIPINAIQGNLNSDIHLLCQVSPNSDDFFHLKVPAKFLKEHLEKFHNLKNHITLYLSTDPKKLFIEERGSGSLNFKMFLVE